MRLQRAVSGATQAANAFKPRLAAIKRAIAETPSLPQRVQDEATALERRTNEILRALSGDTAARRRNMNTPPSINDRVGYVVGAQRMSTARPTQTQINQYNAAAQDFEGVSDPIAAIDRSRSRAAGETIGSGGRTLDTGKNS